MRVHRSIILAAVTERMFGRTSVARVFFPLACPRDRRSAPDACSRFLGVRLIYCRTIGILVSPLEPAQRDVNSYR